ncbi:MAG: cytidine deaminase [Ancrocorticia sp.]|jgi:cytidine deaminase|nr:cytidine deaminase [Ancrocorticia sp.]MCI1896619.1 cytidine deaminase [Ancrocorticia sp.]MCI1933334.1 cytidine deaminase [Ancrocorticia sp.]MCI1963176.1 cytidine deaminase [Ancrocorticia sp.]MCI2013471.1 cytidine deaminase [Ancrocorticia sp.]
MSITDEQWAELHDRAVDAMKHAYAPYSGYPVGAACLTRDGRIFTGCNVENAGYGVTLCAECGMVSEMIKAGSTGIVAFAAVNGKEEPVVPCGRCRQLLSEHVDRSAFVSIPAGILPFEQIMPFGFGKTDLSEVPTSTYKED